MKKKQYTKAFKEEAVKLIREQNYTQAEVSRNLGICSSNIRRWRSEIENGVSNGSAQEKIKPRDEEVLQLRKQIKRLEMERDILKKATAFFASESL